MIRHPLLGAFLISILANVCHALSAPTTYCLAASPDGKIIAANIGGGNGIQIFDLQSGKKIADLESATPEGAKARQAALPRMLSSSWVSQIKFTPDGKRLYCTTYEQDAALIIWDLAHLDTPMFIKSEVAAHFDEVTFTSDSKQLLTFMRASPNGTDFLIALDPVTGKEIWRRSLGADKVGSVKFSSAGDAVRLAGDRSWQDVKSGQPVPEPTDKPAAVHFALPAPRTDTFGTVRNKPYDTELLKITNVTTKQETVVDAKGEIKAALLTPNNLVVAEVSQGLRVWDAQTGKLLFNLGDPDYKTSGGFFGN